MIRIYLQRAEQAKEEGAHVAVVTYYRNAIDIAYAPLQIENILKRMVDYVEELKKPTDQLATLEYAHTRSSFHRFTLTQKIEEMLHNIGGENDATSP